ncbi:hypothetical protein J1N35_023587 [Gossypium stocksii]|uniref:Uncharacterized protein n=1 Tax=Gossypium stocksii TaxID=47602 RepID=A0A9D4A281_9ROSI|nr:hypothetical protein J1N35_023587 [Gossypium stocksii]
MSPDGDGAINGCCPCSLSLGENGIPGSHDDTCKHCTRSKYLSSSPSALSSDSVILVDSNKLWRIFVASAKGFSIGAGLKGGLALFLILARLLCKKSRITSGPLSGLIGSFAYSHRNLFGINLFSWPLPLISLPTPLSGFCLCAVTYLCSCRIDVATEFCHPNWLAK